MANPKHLEMVLDHVPSALILLDADRQILQRNRAAEELIPQLEPGMDIWEAMSSFANEEKVDRIMRGERMVLSAGSDQPAFEWMVTVDRPENGYLVVMAWDASLNYETIQGRITFIMAASHELRSPLTALLGFAEILELDGDGLTAQQAEAVAVIRRNAEHLNSMLDDVIDLSRNSFGELRLELEPLEINGLVDGVCETLRPQIESKEQTLKVSAETGLKPIEADAQRIRQIVFNLLQNAHKHNPPGTNIGVSTRSSDEGIRLAVNDDGLGLPFTNPEDAFRSFRRGPREGDSETAGSGIGLAITRRVVELHRGTISVESTRDEGTTFEVWLPYDREKARLLITPDRT